MYRAKAAGRARYEVFDSEMHRHAVRLLALETELRRAIEREDFVMHYQPIVDLRRPAASSASRVWCAGTTPSAGWSAPATSSASPRRPA